MAKYDPLRDYLSNLPNYDSEIQLTFKQIEDIIGTDLSGPERSAYHLRQWWQNSYSPKRKHVQAIAWHSARWKVKGVDLQLQKVTFCREV